PFSFMHSRKKTLVILVLFATPEVLLTIANDWWLLMCLAVPAYREYPFEIRHCNRQDTTEPGARRQFLSPGQKERQCPSSNLQNSSIPGRRSLNISTGMNEPYNDGKQNAHCLYTARQDGDAGRFLPIHMNSMHGWLAGMERHLFPRRHQPQLWPH